MIFFFFKQKTAYEMRISDWSSDVCSSDLAGSAGTSPGTQRSRQLSGISGPRDRRGPARFERDRVDASGSDPTRVPESADETGTSRPSWSLRGHRRDRKSVV